MTRAHAWFYAVLLSVTFGFSVTAQTVSREQLKKEIESKRQELAALEQQFLSPSDADRSALAGFLSQPDTGVIRLLPRELYDSEVYKNNKKTLTVRGGGAYYSFTRRTHEYGYGTDLQFEADYLSGGLFGANNAMLLKLDGAALGTVSEEHPAIKALIEYQVPGAEPEARVEQRRFSTGAELSGFMFKTRLPAELNGTYVMRSINYDESDIVVVFQILRKDSDGSIIIGWKTLRTFTSPKLKLRETAANSTNK